MTLDQIKAAVDAGKTVHWSNSAYTVQRGASGDYWIHHAAGIIGLTWRDGVTLNGKPEEFYTAIITVVYTLPSRLACALINADRSNLDADENDYLNDWLAEKCEEHGGLFHCVGCEDYGYTHSNDYDNMGADCSRYTFHVNEE